MTGVEGAQGSCEVQGADGDRALFVDGGVYTRNRAFRLFLSSKAGKEAVLQLTGQRSSDVVCSMYQSLIGGCCMPSAASA